MEYISLGKTNMLVSRTAFGAMSLGKVGSPEIAISMVKSAYDEGVNFFDVSKDSPESEILIGKALSSVRKNVFFCYEKFCSYFRRTY